MNKNFISSRQLSLLPERIHKAEETNASKEINKYVRELCKKKNYEPLRIMIVGAGGSYPAAIAISHIIRFEMSFPDVEAYTPQTAIRILDQPSCGKPIHYDLVIGVSYSGTSPDIIAVYQKCKSIMTPFVLFTGNEKELVERKYVKDSLKIVSYYNPEDSTGKELGMISMFSTLAPIVVFDDYVISSNPNERRFKVYKEFLDEGKRYVSKLDIPKIAQTLKRRPIILVLHDWSTKAIAEDINSKFMESGLAYVSLYDEKNFSHGAYTSLYKQRFGMVIKITRFGYLLDLDVPHIPVRYTDYDDELDKFLKSICKRHSAIYLELGNQLIFLPEMIMKEMSMLPYLITAIGEELGVDISEPFAPKPFPAETRALYKYEGEF